MSDNLSVQQRSTRGKRNAKRMRQKGSIPAILYGHGETPVSLSVPSDQFAAVLRHGARVVDLTGDLSEKALIRDLQWDAFGSEVLHIDLTRVSATERIEIEIPIELRGEAPGTREGGVVELVLHTLEISCPAISMPEKIEVNINDLGLNESITASDLELPPEVQLITDGGQMIVHCVEPVEEAAEEEGEAAEPELIGRKEDEEGAEEE